MLDTKGFFLYTKEKDVILFTTERFKEGNSRRNMT
jgi:hypothetical protein